MAEPFVDLGFARVDTDRAERCGFPEVIFGAGKTPDEVVAIGRVLLERNGVLLVSRANAEQHQALSKVYPTTRWHERARCLTVELEPWPKCAGAVGVICAGTSDLPVADEAAVTLEVFGNKVDRIADVGVAGVHRLLAVRDRLEACDVLIVVAGMEGALPSAVSANRSSPSRPASATARALADSPHSSACSIAAAAA